MKEKTRLQGGFGWLLILALMCVFLVPRLFTLGTYATADEPLYLKSSAAFYYLVHEGRFDETDLIIHPGVVNLWAGAAGFYLVFPEYATSERTQYPISDGHFREILDRTEFSPIRMLAVTRAITVVIQTAILGAAMFFGMRVLGRWPAVIGFLLLSFDPFYFANSRRLQPDGILAASLLLSVLAYVDYLSSKRRISLVISGVGAGLCWLSKLVGIVLGPMVFGIAVYAWWRLYKKDRKEIVPLIRDLVIWLVVALVIFVALWPAMWVEPISTFWAYFKQSFLMSQQVNSPMYFNGELNPEGEFGLKYFYYYALVLFNLTTPVVLVGLIAGTIAFFSRQVKDASPRRIRFPSAAMLIAFAIFLVVMTASIKKADRYIVSAFLMLDLLAGAGFGLAFDWVREKLPQIKTYLFTGAAVLLVGAQIFLVWRVAPYYHSYYNPLWGSADRYYSRFQVGWGEGLDQAANYLNSQENINKKVVYSWYSATFDLFFRFRSQEIDIPPVVLDQRYEDILQADYAVIYLSQWQRQPNTLLLQYLADKQPEYTVVINGFEYAKIYNMREIAGQEGD